jgi:hypothetical protein
VLLAGPIHEALVRLAKCAGRGLADYAGKVLADHVRGSFAFAESRPSDGETLPANQSLDTYAKDAEQLIIVGTTLYSIKLYFEFLKTKAQLGTRLTFVRVREALLKENPDILEQLAFRHGQTTKDALTEYEQVGQFLSDLRTCYPGNVSIVEINTFPMFGMTIVDPFLDGRKMRIQFYLYRRLQGSTKALHIEPTTPALNDAFNSFFSHYDDLVVGAGRAHLATSSVVATSSVI